MRRGLNGYAWTSTTQDAARLLRAIGGIDGVVVRVLGDFLLEPSLRPIRFTVRTRFARPRRRGDGQANPAELNRWQEIAWTLRSFTQ